MNLWVKWLVDGNISESHAMVDFAISGATSSNSISRELSDYEAALME
jgi:hypothetical protein